MTKSVRHRPWIPLKKHLKLTPATASIVSTKGEQTMKKYICDICGWVYDPEIGDPDSGIAAGTAFEDIPDDWECPECGVGKDDFSVYEG